MTNTKNNKIFITGKSAQIEIKTAEVASSFNPKIKGEKCLLQVLKKKKSKVVITLKTTTAKVPYPKKNILKSFDHFSCFSFLRKLTNIAKNKRGKSAYKTTAMSNFKAAANRFRKFKNEIENNSNWVK